MITREEIAKKLDERLSRQLTAIQLTHWAKGIMFDYFEKKQTYEPDHADLIESSILRISSSSKNYRTFLFDTEIIRLLRSLGQVSKATSATLELYNINIIIGQHNSQSRAVIASIQEYIPTDRDLQVRQQGSGVVITAIKMNETEIGELATRIQRHSFVMSLEDYQPSESELKS